MLARFKWLIAAACFVIQYTVLPMIPAIELYPDVALAGVCTLALVYGPGVGMFYGLAWVCWRGRCLRCRWRARR